MGFLDSIKDAINYMNPQGDGGFKYKIKLGPDGKALFGPDGLPIRDESVPIVHMSNLEVAGISPTQIFNGAKDDFKGLFDWASDFGFWALVVAAILITGIFLLALFWVSRQ